MVAQSSGQWSDFGLIRGPFRLERSDQRPFRAHLERTRCFERTLIWSEDTLVWDGLIRGYFRLARSDQRALSDGTSARGGLWLPLNSFTGNNHSETFQALLSFLVNSLFIFFSFVTIFVAKCRQVGKIVRSEHTSINRNIYNFKKSDADLTSLLTWPEVIREITF